MSEKIEDLSKADLIVAEIYSRPNYLNGKYKVGELIGLNDLGSIKSNDIFFAETLRVRANSADKIIAEAEAQDKDTNNPDIMRELGKEINALGTPIHKSEAIMHAILTSLRITLYFVIASGIWGLVFKKSIFWFALCGGIFGLIICLLFVAPVIAYSRTKQKIGDMVFGAYAIVGNIAIIIGIAGIIALVIRLIFFK